MSGRTGELPDGARLLRRTPTFDQDTLPPGLRRGHRTRQGVWGVIRVIEGRLRYRVIEPAAERTLDPQHRGIIEPAQLHEVEPLGPVRFFVEFYADPATAEKPATPPGRQGNGAARHG
jgi:tellurite resistance-related uncharacterized protein